MIKCLVCSGTKFQIVWNDKIRVSRNTFSGKKEIVLKCKNCELVFLKNKRKNLEDSFKARKIYNKNASIKEFLSFHTNRELNKLKSIISLVKIKNKKVLESNCGAGVILNFINKDAKYTAGIDNIFYKNYLTNNNHNYFSSIDEAISKKRKFDIIFCLSEIEHKYNPKKFVEKLKKILSKNGLIIFRIPNFNNIYMYCLGPAFLKYDYRSSHNFYFSEKNLDIFFKKIKLKVIRKIGHNEYDLNHLITYIKSKKRVDLKMVRKNFDKKTNNFFKINIEKALASTSLIYIVKK